MSAPGLEMQVYDDDELSDGELSDGEGQKYIPPPPKNFVDYLYLRYGPHIYDAWMRQKPYINGARQRIGFVYKGMKNIMWGVTTSMIIYSIPLMLAFAREEQSNAKKDESGYKPPVTGSTAPPEAAKAEMLLPPGA
eukprot:CAMPEP_0167764618 /NCGR_PEP_ID=MMETSP0110_2-20121227/14158_1 /TAXON_ID=629695 /ORGANISM="Gymnochlora sp., Strain CCMP2014" /LENGTH=135 /DNA_ID=CAMNT_0007652093 /DNA_START=1 /DNA_END=408 /DNA_ORIENTATION=+